MKTIRKKRLLTNITRKNIIGKGREGTVYDAVNSNGIHYALKEGPLGKQEVEFAETVAAKYPEHFMQLYDHREGMALWSKVNTTLKEFHGSKKYMYIQIFKILTILEKEGWTHNDFHPSNIGIEDGTKVKIIDYGLVRKGFQPGRDIYKLFSIVKQNGIDTDLYQVKKKKLDKPTMELVKPYIPSVSKFMQMDLQVLLLDLLAPKEFRRLYPGLEVPHVLSKSIMLYIIKNIDKPEACLQYILKRNG